MSRNSLTWEFATVQTLGEIEIAVLCFVVTIQMEDKVGTSHSDHGVTDSSSHVICSKSPQPSVVRQIRQEHPAILSDIP